MKIEQFKAELLAYLLPFFDPLGFKYVKSNHEFIKKTPELELSYPIICTSFSGFISIDIGAYISFLTPQKKLKKILPKECTALSIGGDIRWIIKYLNSQGANYEEINFVSYHYGTDPHLAFEKLKIIFETICMDFFQQCANLQTCNLLYNYPPFMHTAITSRIFFGILVAKLCNDKNLPQLIKVYDEKIKEYSDRDKELYPLVRAYVSQDL
jgi:hypothetical protein